MVWVRVFGSVDLVNGMGLGPCRSMVVVSLLISGFFFFFFFFEMGLVISGSGLMVLVLVLVVLMVVWV